MMSHIYTIGGGKGGVGKSFITANLGILCAKQGHRVLLVDLDLGASNLHTFLALKDPRVGLQDFLSKRCSSLGDTASPTGIPNLSIICSTNCSLEAPNLSAIKCIPQDQLAVLISGQNAMAARAYGHGIHAATVPIQLLDLLAQSYIPSTHAAIFGA